MDDRIEVPQVNHRDQDELDDVIAALTDDECVRLMARAHVAALGSDLSGEDLFQEAVEALLAGLRPWRTDVPFEAHMTMVMKSIGYNRRRAMRLRPTDEIDVLDERPERAAERSVEDNVGSTLRARQLLQGAERALANDEVGLALFLARAEGLPPDEVCQFAGIPREEYETVYKRVQRKIARAVAAGELR